MTDKTAPEVLADTGRALFDSEDWQSRLAKELGVGRSTIQYWRNGKMPFGPDHPALDRLLGLVERRRAGLEKAEAELREWLRRNRG